MASKLFKQPFTIRFDIHLNMNHYVIRDQEQENSNLYFERGNGYGDDEKIRLKIVEKCRLMNIENDDYLLYLIEISSFISTNEI